MGIFGKCVIREFLRKWRETQDRAGVGAEQRCGPSWSAAGVSLISRGTLTHNLYQSHPGLRKGPDSCEPLAVARWLHRPGERQDTKRSTVVAKLMGLTV